jgi:hypothetical protein
MFAQVANQPQLNAILPLPLWVVQRSPLGQILRREGMHFNLEIAVGRYLRDELLREQP